MIELSRFLFTRIEPVWKQPGEKKQFIHVLLKQTDKQTTRFVIMGGAAMNSAARTVQAEEMFLRESCFRAKDVF